MPKQCNPKSDKAQQPDVYICNPATGSWVKKSGAIGKKLLASQTSPGPVAQPKVAQPKVAQPAQTTAGPDVTLAKACLGKSKGQGGMNVGDMYLLAKSKGYAGPKTRGGVTKFLCKPQSAPAHVVAKPQSAPAPAPAATPKPVVAKPTGSCESGNDGTVVFSGDVLLAKEYLDKKTGEPSFDPTDWWVSEKFDGYRSVWNGQSFVSRSGKPFIVPDWFSALMPPNIALDGEFWVGRGCFQSCGIFRKKIPDTQEWINSEVIYKVFDLPSSNKPFEQRMIDLKKVVDERCSCMVKLKLPDAIVTVKCPLENTEQIKVTSAEHVDEMFHDVIEGGGEGLMLRQAGSHYEQKRSGTLRKLKVAFDTECSIIDYKPGTGKYTGMLGSFKCELSSKKAQGPSASGKFFFVSGMNDQTRVDYLSTHPKGTIITVTFNDYSKDGIPRHPRYLRKRTDAGL
jgi:hypothetical protein